MPPHKHTPVTFPLVTGVLGITIRVHIYGKDFTMPERVDEWRPVRTVGKGAQGKSVLVQRRSDGVLAIRKQVHNYNMINGLPLEAVILQEILPRSRRVIKLMTFSFEPSHRPRDDLIEWFEYCRGGDLQHAMERSGSLSEDFIWHCFIQVAEALDVVHNAGSQRVVHRDVKPDNIFLDEKYLHEAPWPDLKLGDFGAAVLKEHTTDMCIPCWQGPELPHHSAAGDIWGLGAVIHWLGHGQPPIAPRPARFRGSQREWEEQPGARKPMPLPTLYSSNLNEYMMLCLKWNPDDRISSQDLVDCLKVDRPRPRPRWH